MTEIAPWVPAVAAVIAAAIAGVAGYMTASWKTRELKLAYEHRTRDNYLENARTVSTQVYIPLAVATSKLNRAYGKFRVHIDFNGAGTPIGAINRFKAACNVFDEIVTDLLERGASAYLTITLEEELTSFSLFLQESQNATHVVRKLTLSPQGLKVQNLTFKSALRSKISLLIESVSLAISVLGAMTPLSMSIEDKIIASPLSSREFEQRFQEGVVALSALIKEVTLGSRSAPLS